ncbi:MAG: hypothetical protein V3T23_03975 [Nitrososphaerales archaeon]
MPQHIDKKKKKKKKVIPQYAELNELKGVEVLRTGRIRGKVVDKAFLEDVVANTKALMTRDLHAPPGKLGHDDDQAFAKMSGLPATGWVESLKVVGDRLLADFKDVPNIIMEAFEKKLFKKISSEVWFELPDPETGKEIGPALRAVAFLGADIPEIKGLKAFLSDSLAPLKLAAKFAEAPFESASDINITIALPGDKEPTVDPVIDMRGFKPAGDPTIIGDPNELTIEGLKDDEKELFREAESIMTALGERGFEELGDAPTVDSLMQWVGSVEESVFIETPEVKELSAHPERLFSWLQEHAKERGLLRAEEKTKEEEQQVEKEVEKLTDELKTSEAALATAEEKGKDSVKKLDEMKAEVEELTAKIETNKNADSLDRIKKFKEAHKETLIPALHPIFDALTEAVMKSDGPVVVKLSDNKEEKLEDQLSLVLKYTEEVLKAKAVKLAETGKGSNSKRSSGEGSKGKTIAGATKGVALDDAAMKLVHEDTGLSAMYAKGGKHKNEAYNEAVSRVRIENPDIDEEEDA